MVYQSGGQLSAVSFTQEQANSLGLITITVHSYFTEISITMWSRQAQKRELPSIRIVRTQMMPSFGFGCGSLLTEEPSRWYILPVDWLGSVECEIN